MISKFLLPNKVKTVGWLLFVPSFIMGVLWLSNIKFEVQSPVLAVWSKANEVSVKNIHENDIKLETTESNKFFKVITKDIYNDIIAVTLLVSLLILTFVKEKNEDEYISKIRLDSLVWATQINFILLLLTIIFVFKDSFTTIMIFNMFTTLILFIIRFNVVLYLNRRQLGNEK